MMMMMIIIMMIMMIMMMVEYLSVSTVCVCSLQYQSTLISMLPSFQDRYGAKLLISGKV